MIINNNESVAQIAKDLDIHSKTLFAWVTAYKKEHNMPIRYLEKSNTLKESESEELKRLRRENKILKPERDIVNYPIVFSGWVVVFNILVSVLVNS